MQWICGGWGLFWLRSKRWHHTSLMFSHRDASVEAEHTVLNVVCRNATMLWMIGIHILIILAPWGNQYTIFTSVANTRIIWYNWPSRMGAAVALYTHIREVLSSNLALDTSYPAWSFPFFCRMRRFLTVLTKARYRILSLVTQISTDSPTLFLYDSF